jgi:hypothetical protein
MVLISMKTARVVATALLLPCLGGHAAAQTAYDLRALSLDVGWTVVNNHQVNPTASYQDKFANGDPLTGGQYTNAITPSPLYNVRNSGFSPGAEASVNDFFGQNFGVGRLRFSLDDAIAAPNNLDLPGTVNMVNRITLRDPAAGAFATSAQSLSADAAFMFATPDVGSYYGLRLSDGVGSSPFDDQIDLRIVRNASGAAVLNLRRLSSTDGTTLVNTPLGNAAVASFLNAGKSLSDIAAIAFEMSYLPAGQGGGGLRAGVDLIDSFDNEIGHYDFFDASGGSIYPQIFHGETFTHVSAGANWTVTSVPEPGTWALMFSGLGALAFVVRRRRA